MGHSVLSSLLFSFFLRTLLAGFSIKRSCSRNLKGIPVQCFLLLVVRVTVKKRFFFFTEVSDACVSLCPCCLGDIVATRLSTHTDDVDFMNQRCFDELPGSPHTFKAIDSEGSSSELLDACAPTVLHLKVGTQVMLTKNTQLRAGLANGSRGVVVGFDPSSGEPHFKVSAHIFAVRVLKCEERQWMKAKDKANSSCAQAYRFSGLSAKAKTKREWGKGAAFV